MKTFRAHFGKGAPPGGLEIAVDYSAKLNEMVKVLDFVQLGGPTHTELRTFRCEILI